MITRDTISILIPTYNREQYIEETLDSCFAQTHRDLFILLYDDGSTDNTVSVIFRILKKKVPGDLRERILLLGHETNQGQGVARLEMLRRMPKTDLACWQDSDDVMHPDRLRRQLKSMREGGYDVVFSYLKFFSGKNPGKGGSERKIDVSRWSKDPLSIWDNTNTATALFNRKAAALVPSVPINHGGYDMIWSYSMIVHGLRIGCIPDYLYYCRRHPGRIVNRKHDPDWVMGWMKEQPLVSAEMRKLKNRA